MDNCDLEKLSVSGGKLHPPFKPEVTDYKMTVESSVNQVTVNLLTSDCGASYSIVSHISNNAQVVNILFRLITSYHLTSVSFIFQLFGDGSCTINLNEGLNGVEIEVVAEDGTIRKYSVGITKLSAKLAVLSNLTVEGNIPLHPAFSSKVYEYNS